MQPVSSLTNQNSRNLKFGTSYRLNLPRNNTDEVLYDLERLLKRKNIPLNKFSRTQSLVGDENSVNVVSKFESIDVFVKEKVSLITSKRIEISDEGDLFSFANRSIFPLFRSDVLIKK